MPTASAIRELSAAKNAPWIAAAFFEETIQIWDLATSEQISEFESVFSLGGGDRLTLHPEGETCVAAAWNKGRQGGVACYDAAEGTLRWHREDLMQTQFARFSLDGRTLRVGVEAGPLQVLEAATGMTIDKFAGIKAVFNNPYSNVRLLETRKRGYFLQGTNKVRIPNLSFALLDVAFSPNRVCVSESGGPVRCLDCDSGLELWRYDPPRHSHVLRLRYRPADQLFYGVQWEYETGASRALISFAGEDGQGSELCQLDSWYEEFCLDGDAVVTSKGDLISTADGAIKGHLAFPQKDYPDI